MTCYMLRPGKSEVFVTRDVLDSNGLIAYEGGKTYQLDEEEICGDFLGTCGDMNKNISPFHLLLMYARGVCPKSLASDEIDILVSMEHYAMEYGIPPFKDLGYEDYPARMTNTFTTIANTRERVKMEDIRDSQQQASAKAANQKGNRR